MGTRKLWMIVNGRSKYEFGGREGVKKRKQDVHKLYKVGTLKSEITTEPGVGFTLLVWQALTANLIVNQREHPREDDYGRVVGVGIYIDIPPIQGTRIYDRAVCGTQTGPS